MAKEFKLPDLGSGLQEGQIVNWLVEVGQTVTTSDDLCEIETEKAVIEIPVPYAGTILELKANVGDSVPVGDVLAIIGDAGETATAPHAATGTRRGYGIDQERQSRQGDAIGAPHRART